MQFSFIRAALLRGKEVGSAYGEIETMSSKLAHIRNYSNLFLYVCLVFVFLLNLFDYFRYLSVYYISGQYDILPVAMYRELMILSLLSLLFSSQNLLKMVSILCNPQHAKCLLKV